MVEQYLFEFRPLDRRDMPMLYEWIFRPHVRRWWNDPYHDLEDVIADFTRDADCMLRTIAVLDGRDFGYFQAWWDLAPDGEVGIDQFIADPNQVGKGLGRQAVAAFCRLVFRRMSHIQCISLDPDPANPRAIRAYEKAGFRHIPSRSTETKYLMTIQRSDVYGPKHD